MLSSEMRCRRPANSECSEFHWRYVRLVPDGDIINYLTSQQEVLRGVFAQVTEQAAAVLHPPYTWTIKQVVGHLIDAERIFTDRLHRFASGEQQPQPGMDQDVYVAGHNYELPRLDDLVRELLLCRESGLLLIRRIRPEAWDNRGQASGLPVTVRALIWMLAGHIDHHLAIVRRRLTLAEPVKPEGP